jgi:hypothetical protein
VKTKNQGDEMFNQDETGDVDVIDGNLIQMPSIGNEEVRTNNPKERNDNQINDDETNTEERHDLTRDTREKLDKTGTINDLHDSENDVQNSD